MDFLHFFVKLPSRQRESTPMPADVDFATVLKSARERSGLTQVQLARSCDLTGSYISLMESGRRPPPSDDVVRRLAEVLAIPEEELLRHAHMERAPGELRDTVMRLREQARKERTLRERTAEALVPFSLWGMDVTSLPSHHRASAGEGAGSGVMSALSRLLDLARSSPDLASFREQSRRTLESLSEDDRRDVVEQAPLLAERAPIARVRRFTAAAPGLPPEVRTGDLLLVDPAAVARAGDIVVDAAATPGAPVQVSLYVEPNAPHGGVVVEIRRRLRT
jgi:transcriptional regulator with XRE-family HTH domain